MDLPYTDNQVLDRFSVAARATYGARLHKLVLFGSRARGDATPQSDYDVAVFLNKMGNLYDELGPLAEITTEILMQTGSVISAKPLPASAYNDPRPLMKSIRRDGVNV